MKIVGALMIVGWALLTAAAGLIYAPAGVAVAGLACLKLARDAA